MWHMQQANTLSPSVIIADNAMTITFCARIGADLWSVLKTMSQKSHNLIRLSTEAMRLHCAILAQIALNQFQYLLERLGFPRSKVWEAPMVAQTCSPILLLKRWWGLVVLDQLRW